MNPGVREVKLTPMEMDLFKKMNYSEQISAKRIMWMISDVSDDTKAEEFRDMLTALFQGAYMRYVDRSGVRYYNLDQNQRLD